MNINQSNYENYFLLYVDGELSETEMQTVVSFALENKDLANELEVLLQTKLNNEQDTYFENKSTLYRTEATSINSINYEEQFLLLIDDELNITERKKILEFILQNPGYSDELELLKQTKLPNESIGFTHKNLLFREAKTEKPILFLSWKKLAVAAALIGIITISGLLFLKNKNESVFVKNNKSNEWQASSSKVLKAQSNNNSTITNHRNTVLNNNSLSKKAIIPIQSSNIITSKLIEKNQLLITKTEIKETNSADTQTVAINTQNDPSLNTIKTLDQSTEIPNNIIPPSNNHHDEKIDNNYMHPTVYKELDTDDERKSLYLGSVEINRDKLRGFFRKATTIFKSKNKSDEDKSESANIRSLK